MNEFVCELKSKGLILELQGDDLLLRGEKVDQPTLEKIKQHKEQLKNLLMNAARNKKPYINQRGGLIIAFDSDPRYHYWNGGQEIQETLWLGARCAYLIVMVNVLCPRSSLTVVMSTPAITR